MEAAGQIACFARTEASQYRVFTINLHVGKIPTEMVFAGLSYARCAVQVKDILVSYGFYRPNCTDFRFLSPQMQQDILDGFLISAPLREAVVRAGNTAHEVQMGWTEYSLDHYFLNYYGCERKKS